MSGGSELWRPQWQSTRPGIKDDDLTASDRQGVAEDYRYAARRSQIPCERHEVARHLQTS